MSHQHIFTEPSTNMIEIIAICEKIQNCTDLVSAEKLYEKYGNYNHPQICCEFGKLLSIMGNKDRAKGAFEKGASYGLVYPCAIYNSPLIDSIGQCLSDLVIYYPIKDTSTATKVTSLAYIYLSRCIELYKREAQDSYRTRALLFKQHNNPMIPQGILFKNMGLGVLMEPFILSDFYFSSQATNSPFRIEGLQSAQDIHNRLEDISVGGKDADDYTLAEIALLGESRHLILFKILEEKYKKGEFNLTLDELISVTK